MIGKEKVKLKTGKVSGVGGPQGVPATGPLNSGAILLNVIGPRVNGGKIANIPAPMGTKVKGKKANHTHLSKIGK